jgi:hypothetical protein
MSDFPDSLVIIGAPRSGTNILRDVLTGLPEFSTWPCDEINFVWKHGNISHPYDDLPAEAAGEQTRRFVRKQFKKLSRRTNARYVVEKTCANSLRLDYVDRIVPEAHYVLLVREGQDAVASAKQRWEHPHAASSYYLNKARYIAPSDFLTVLWQTVQKRLGGSARKEGAAWTSWGPVTAEIEGFIANGRSIPEISALQWAQCVSSSLRFFEQLDHERWVVVSYEDFVHHPEEEVKRILKMLGTSARDAVLTAACKKVDAGRVGKSGDLFSDEQLQRVNEMTEPVMVAMRNLQRSI